ncbi:hypothetical protein R3P38DRAFT_2604101 [Favolaschia claudopus]|uniref:Alpha-type protein kinase domain-containing protein n=1 Tax=Favolaschia claudopus TaxID=2862362 RepID=A0AAW0DLN8_9AGAR
MIWCSGCGEGFKHLAPSRTICFKCEKRDACNDNETELAAVEKMKQCTGCGFVFRHLASLLCNQCVSRDAKATKPTKGKENMAAKAATIQPQQSQSVISVDSDSDDLQEVTQDDMAAMRIRLKQNKKLSSGLRLTPKVKEETLGRTGTFLKMREASRKRTDLGKTVQILFKFNLVLQKPTGQKVGTCVPAQSRSFPLDDTMEHVFRTVVNSFQEAGGRWAQNYPGKTFVRKDVYFTFANGTDISSAFTGDSTFFKKSAIANSTAEMTMYVPIELTLDVLSDSDDEFEDILRNKKRKTRGKSRANGRADKKPRIRVKEEVSDNDLQSRIKSEPTESELGFPQARASGTQVTARFRLNSAVTFKKEYLSNTLDRPQPSQLYHGVRDVVVKHTPSLGTHFQLSCGDDHYLARRFEDNQFRFNTALELNAAHAELLRGKRLHDLLQILIEKYGMLNACLAECSTPELFIATILDNDTVLGHLVCQPIPAIPFNQVVQPELDLLNAISHYSLAQNDASMLFVKFKVASSGGAMSIFAPVTHSSLGDSGVDDGGPQAIEDFKSGHVCNDFCAKFGLEAF